MVGIVCTQSPSQRAASAFKLKPSPSRQDGFHGFGCRLRFRTVTNCRAGEAWLEESESERAALRTAACGRGCCQNRCAAETLAFVVQDRPGTWEIGGDHLQSGTEPFNKGPWSHPRRWPIETFIKHRTDVIRSGHPGGSPSIRRKAPRPAARAVRTKPANP